MEPADLDRLNRAAQRLFCIGATTMLLVAPAMAQTAAPEPVPVQALQASLSHTIAKGPTFNVLTFSVGTAIYSLGTGSVPAAAALSAIVTSGAFVLYIGNDYMWDRF